KRRWRALMVDTASSITSFDVDAVRIGELFEKARRHIEASVELYIDAGMALLAKRATLPYGKWEPWLAANADQLGFGARTARRLRGWAKRTPASDLNPREALGISRELWGHGRRYRSPPLPPPQPFIPSGSPPHIVIAKSEPSKAAVTNVRLIHAAMIASISEPPAGMTHNFREAAVAAAEAASRSADDCDREPGMTATEAIAAITAVFE